MRIGLAKRSGRERRQGRKAARSAAPQTASPLVRRLFQGDIKLVSVADRPDMFPMGRERVPEVAFAGRSNVGKSSLLKELAVKRAHVPVENRPGTTRTLDFYELARELRIVDLPGYGFAFAQDELKDQWADTIDAYLRDRRSLKRVMVLVDARHGLKPGDMDFFDKLDGFNRRFQVVLTKCDLVDQTPLAATATAISERIGDFKHSVPELMVASSVNRGGLGEIRNVIASLVSYQPFLERVERDTVGPGGVTVVEERSAKTKRAELKARIAARKEKRDALRRGEKASPTKSDSVSRPRGGSDKRPADAKKHTVAESKSGGSRAERTTARTGRAGVRRSRGAKNERRGTGKQKRGVDKDERSGEKFSSREGKSKGGLAGLWRGS